MAVTSVTELYNRNTLSSVTHTLTFVEIHLLVSVFTRWMREGHLRNR